MHKPGTDVPLASRKGDPIPRPAEKDTKAMRNFTTGDQEPFLRGNRSVDPRIQDILKSPTRVSSLQKEEPRNISQKQFEAIKGEVSAAAQSASYSLHFLETAAKIQHDLDGSFDKMIPQDLNSNSNPGEVLALVTNLFRAQQQSSFVMSSMLRQATFAARATAGHIANSDANFLLTQRDNLLRLPEVLERFRGELRAAPMTDEMVFPNREEVTVKAHEERKIALHATAER